MIKIYGYYYISIIHWKFLTAKSTAAYMNLCEKVMESVEELTTILQDMTIKDTSVFTNFQSLQ